MSLYLGNKKVAPVVYIGSKTLTVINKSSSAVKKGDSVWINESPDYSYDFYKVGDVVVDNNTKVASNFSTRNAIKMSKFIDFSNSWEMNFKITTGSDVTSRQKLNGSLDDADYLFPTIEFSRSGYSQLFMLCISSTGSSWDISSDAVGTYQIQPNTTYWVRFGWDGSVYYLDYSVNGKDYIRDITVNSSLPVYNSNKYMGIGNDLYTGYSQVPFLGEIDLLETYIKSNNNVWWLPVTALPKEYHIVDYKESTSSSILGVATEDIAIGTKEVNVENGGIETDGIMSTYVADQTRTGQITVYKNKRFEGVFKVKASEWYSNDNHFIQTMDNFFYVRGGGGYLWSVLKHYSEYYTQTPFSSTDWIYIKIEHCDGWLAWSYSLDGENYELMHSQSGSTTFLDGVSTFTFNLYFGCKYGSTGYETWNGQIDFNECYFKVDDKIVWSGVKYVNGGTGLVKINTTSEVIEKEIQKEKYGLTVEAFLGDVDENGVLQQPTEAFDLKFTGVKTINTNKMFYYAFYKKPSIASVDFDTVEYIGDYSFNYAFSECPNITTAIFPKLTSVDSYGLSYAFDKSGVTSAFFPMLETVGKGGLNYAFDGSKLTSITFPVLKTVGENGLMYALNADNLTSVSFPMLESVGSQGLCGVLHGANITGTLSFPSLTTVDERGLYSAFGSNYNMTSVLFPMLKTAGDYAFMNAFQMANTYSSLETVEFPVLETIGGNCFYGTFYQCQRLASISFPSLTSVQENSFGSSSSGYAFRSCSKLTEIHFRADMQEIISTLTGYSNKFGASKATIYFDL